MKKWLQAIPQMLLLLLFSWLGKAVAAVFHLHVPGSLIGMMLLFVALQAGWVRLTWVEAGAALLFGEMILFFVPTIVGIVQVPWLLGTKGLLVLLVVLSGTALVMVSTGVIAERLHRMREGKRRDCVERV
ncbi:MULTISPECIES: CidA/LrgA family protein [Bacillales]|jgi:holin-like protein|uniref:Murein hydrolase regulator LrgA n=1 Tax=Brevibacillus aydinogluensis TaxID=927786 RepID=A0AA48MA55_9BACL|nr:MULTISPECIES: CidA/LrgA family protein [Bacillales]REK66831.1 MAG: murein hydrolase regulator LrgA [Brevibacillus sp.]MBR8658824.1 CidA/LrgA family protein [Brevibacillus sp. NL20B1]MDT3416436.1 holin-like protein [Brevibacillus aydinogluensis]NNV02322.1 CidA/LrgA family protein [Brevibacillus sp. MCWH]UFJ62759.1 CidA/LrgA family protein [Anoxybacillus sediminis]